MAGTYAYVANYTASTVSKIDLSTFTAVGSALAVGTGPVSIAIDPSGTYAYVANNGASTVSKINLSTFTTVGSALAVGTHPQSIAIDPSGTYAYVANYTASTVSKINLSTFTTVGSALAAGTNPISIAIPPVVSYTVTFNANGGSGTMANETHSSATALTPNAFTRTGYTFSHWNTAADNSGTSYADGASYPFTASVTLYAIWTPTYTASAG